MKKYLNSKYKVWRFKNDRQFIYLAHNISRRVMSFQSILKILKNIIDFKSYIIEYKMEIKDKGKWGIENGLTKLRIHDETLWIPLV